jgi:alkyldihydroxyacetonephosphate synthase
VSDPTRSPVAPAAVAGAAADARSRFRAETGVDDVVLARLGTVCAEVDASLERRVDAGRDWWPLGVAWAAEGTVAAIPDVVCRPASAAEVAAVLAVCDGAGIPVTAAAGRSGVCGGSVPAFGGVALDLTGLAGIIAVDDHDLLVDVAAGTWGDDFEGSLRRHHGLTLGHWPQSIAISTVGGWLACRGAGQYSTRYGKIEDMVAGVEVALADGRLIRTATGAPRAAVGPDLTQVFVGSEGTLGVITEARLRVHPAPAVERRAAWGFPDFAGGLDACRRILRRGATPAVLRLYDRTESGRQFDGIDTNVLIVVDEGDEMITDTAMALTAEECAGATRLDAGLAGRWLERRNEVPSLASLAAAGIVADTIEVAAAWRALPSLYSEVVAAVTALEGTLVTSAHQSHAYADGACIYFTFAGRPADQAAADQGPSPAEAYYRAAWDAVMAVTRRHGGAISHHHGIGINRGRFLREAWGEAFEVLVALKGALDPHGVLNPAKLGLPSRFGPTPWP